MASPVLAAIVVVPAIVAVPGMLVLSAIVVVSAVADDPAWPPLPQAATVRAVDRATAAAARARRGVRLVVMRRFCERANPTGIAHALPRSDVDVHPQQAVPPSRGEISHRLWKFHTQAAACDIPAVHRLATTIDTWWPAIEAALLTGYSNARSEGYNRLAKHQGRNAFGFRNTTNQTRRIRWACTRQHRRATASTTEQPAQV